MRILAGERRRLCPDDQRHRVTNESVLGRLLEEISWEGSGVRRYRRGGRGLENVLSAQVLQALDLLPRALFLGAVVRGAHGADAARAQVVDEVEALGLTFLPDEVRLRDGGVRVQPDATLTGPSTYSLIEAKGPGRSRFNPSQLSRSYRAVLQEAGDRTPLMLLVLGGPPPVRVAGRGVHEPVDALVRELEQDLPVGDPGRAPAPPTENASEVLAWTTWRDVAAVVERQLSTVQVADPGVAASIRRVAVGLVQAVAWHSEPRR